MKEERKKIVTRNKIEMKEKNKQKAVSSFLH